MENISARYDEQTKGAERSRETEPCENGDDKRYSDLCAQWKAADSAQLAAWLSGASFAAVLIALYLAFRSNGIARDTAKHQLRAYLAVKPMGINLLIGSHKVIGQVALENMGSTPAYNVSLKVRMDICDEKDRISFEFPEDIEKTDRAVHPGLQMPQGSFDNPNLSKINMAGKYAYVWGVVYYSDAFGKRRFTRFCHRYSTSSRNQTEILRHTLTIRASIQTIVAIDPDKARYHKYGNDAD